MRLLLFAVAGLACAAFAVLMLAEHADAKSPTYRVFATREGLVGHTTANGHVIKERDHFVALPSRRALACKGCHNMEVRVCNPANGRCETAPVWDVGPWNTKDDYWNPSSVREMFSDLPRGKPEAQAAYYDGYNGGKDMFGRTVKNPAGIDLADGTFWDGLRMTNNGWVDVTFLWIDEGDATPPTTPSVSESHTGGGWSQHAHPSWSWSASDPQSGVAKYEVDPSWGATFTTTSTSYHPTLGTGGHSIRVRAQNGDGLWSPWSGAKAAYVDVTPPNAPSVSESHSGAAWTSHNHPLFSWSNPGDAGSGVASYVAEVDGARTGIGGSLSHHPTLADGVHTFRAYAVDGVGLWSSASNAITVRVDATPPITDLSMANPATLDGKPLVNGSSAITLSARDATSGVAETRYRFNGGTWIAYKGSFDAGGLPDGGHTLEWQSRDVAGNWEAVRSRAFALDATPPVVSFETPSDGAIVVTLGETEVRAAATDALSGVARVAFVVDGRERSRDFAAPWSFAWRAGEEAVGDHVLAATAWDLAGNRARIEETVHTVPTSAKGAEASAERAAAVASNPPTLGVAADCDRARGTCRVGLLVGARFVGVEVPHP